MQLLNNVMENKSGFHNNFIQLLQSFIPNNYKKKIKWSNKICLFFKGIYYANLPSVLVASEFFLLCRHVLSSKHGKKYLFSTQETSMKGSWRITTAASTASKMTGYCSLFKNKFRRNNEKASDCFDSDSFLVSIF